MSILYTKNSKFLAPSKLSQELFKQLQYGQSVELNENFSSSIEFVFISEDKQGIERGDLHFLKNILKSYKLYSEKYDPSYYQDGTNVRMIKIPSIYFGSSIQKETIKLETYFSGSLICRLEDIGGNGELKQTYPHPDGDYDTCGVALYNHGVILITSSNDFINCKDYYLTSSGMQTFQWIYFGTGSSITGGTTYNLQFNGTEIKPTITLNIPIEKHQYNYSNNPTSYKQEEKNINNIEYIENKYIQPYNLVSSSYSHDSASYEKHTYITKVGIYDKNKNLIGIAKLANPILKTEDREYNIKLKLDL